MRRRWEVSGKWFVILQGISFVWNINNQRPGTPIRFSWALCWKLVSLHVTGVCHFSEKWLIKTHPDSIYLTDLACIPYLVLENFSIFISNKDGSDLSVWAVPVYNATCGRKTGRCFLPMQAQWMLQTAVDSRLPTGESRTMRVILPWSGVYLWTGRHGFPD